MENHFVKRNNAYLFVMAEEQNSEVYSIGLGEFLDSVYGGSRIEVLDGFEEMADQTAGNLEKFQGYEDVDISYTGPIAETFAGPVMNGVARDNSRTYRISAEEDSEFEVKIRDTSMAFASSSQGLVLDTENEYRDLILNHEEGSEQLYSDFTEEFRNILGTDSSEYQRDEEEGRWLFKFQREDVEGLEEL